MEQRLRISFVYRYIRPEKRRELERLHEEHDSGEYVVAILGGSVAEWFGNYVADHQEYADQLSSVIPNMGIVGFA